MRHYIIVKFKDREVLDEIMGSVRDIFERTLVIEGIHSVRLDRCCINRDNRYDLMITIDMDKEALSSYDISEPHREWKEKYGSIIEKKAIFDCED